MASPFTIFRKHQGWLMAGATLLAMFAFVVFGSGGGGGGGPARSQQATPIASWKFGQITREEVLRQIALRKELNGFLVALRQAGGGSTENLIQFPAAEFYVIRSMILAKKAELLGMAITDQGVNDYLDAVSLGHLSAAEKDQLFARAFNGQYSQEQVFNALRFELLANNFADLLASDAVEAGTPLERWDYFSRLYRRASIQALGVEVKDFVSKVPEPTEADLQTFFEQYKDQQASLLSPEPGFRQPDRAKFEYFKTDKAKMTAALKPKITDAEIVAYYAANKDKFVHSDLDDLKPKPDDKPKIDLKPKPDDKPKTGEQPKAAETPTKTDGKPKTDEKPKTDDQPKVDDKPKASQSPKADEKPKPADSPKTDDKPKPDDKRPPATPKSDDKSSLPAPAPAGKLVDSRGQTVGRHDEELLAFADPAPAPSTPDATPKKDEPGKSPAPAAEPAKTEPAKTDAPKTEPAKVEPPKPEPAKTEAPKTEPPKTEPPKTVPSHQSPAPSPQSPTSTKPGTSAKPAPKPVRYDSVDDPKVRDTIRTTLAQERAATMVTEAFKNLDPQVSAYARTLSTWKANAAEGEQPPAPPDFKALAKAAGVEFAQTQWLSQDEAFLQLELDKAYVLTSTRIMRFPAVGFDPNERNYHPEKALATDAENEYLWWRTDFKPAYVPEFKDVEDQVRLTWKMLQARKLATAKAQQYTDQVNHEHKTLKEAFQFLPGINLHEIESFTWLSQSTPQDPSQRRSFGLSQLSGIEYGGQEFMQKVFSLEPGKAGVAMNQPKTVAYAIQLEDLQPSETVFRQQFVQSLAIPYDPSLQAAYADGGRSLNASIKAIEDEFDYKRLAPAQTPSGSSEPSSDSEDD